MLHVRSWRRMGEWANLTGLTILGMDFFTDQLQTTNHNWTIIKNKIIEFTERTKNRKLSLKGKVLVLNMDGLAKMWYMATVLPVPDWEDQSLEGTIFKFLWDLPEDGKEKGPVGRETIYLSKDREGLGLLHPIHQLRSHSSPFQVFRQHCRSRVQI